MTATTAPPLVQQRSSRSLDTLTASLVARQSRSDDDSLSVQDQIAQMRDYCERNGYIVGAIYEERDVSGRRPLDKRHGLKQAVEDVESGRSQVILTAYFDRFVRSVATRAEVVQRVERAGGVVMTIDAGRTSNATAADKLSGTLLAAIAEFYADQTGEKLMSSKQRNIDRGVPPFPHITTAYERIESGDDKGKLRPHPVNAPLWLEAIEMRLNGASFTTITRHLNERGLAITHTGVVSTLESKLLIGEIHFGDFRPNLDAIDEPLIDRSTFRRLHAARSTRGRYGKSERLLARLDVLRCQTCDARMSVHTSSQRGGKRYAYYRCGNPLCSRPAIISAPRVEDAVRDEAIRLSANVSGHATAADDLEAARVVLEAAESKLASTISLFADTGLAAEPASREVLTELSAKRDAAAETHRHLLALSTPELTLTTSAAWDLLTYDERRRVISAVIARVVIAPGRGTDRVTIEPRRK
jgi:DNA invertase Pin-like site-specific DNA recombinase